VRRYSENPGQDRVLAMLPAGIPGFILLIGSGGGFYADPPN